MFKLTIKTANAAFEDSASTEVARILRDLAEYLDSSGAPDEGTVRDTNGNTVGSWKLSN